MATVEELKAVVKDTLESRGVLPEIKARIRAEVFSALDDQSETRPNLTNENLLINELIREYMEFNHYKYSASVLQAESGQPRVPLDKDFLAQELGVTQDAGSAHVPLLYCLVGQFLSQNKARKDLFEKRLERSWRHEPALHGSGSSRQQTDGDRLQRRHLEQDTELNGDDLEPEPLVLTSDRR